MIDAFGKLADGGFARDTLLVVGGYGAAAGAEAGVSSVSDMDVPTEAYGLAGVVGLEFAPGLNSRQRRYAQVGSAAHAGIAFADRIGVREQVEEAL